MDSSIQSDDANGGAGSQVCVTLDSLSVNGTPPAVGDSVNLSGTVDRIEGDNAYVKVDNSMDDMGGQADEGGQLRSQLDSQPSY